MLSSQVEIDPSISATLIYCVHDDPTCLSVCTRIGIEDECPVYNLYDYGKFEQFLIIMILEKFIIYSRTRLK